MREVPLWVGKTDDQAATYRREAASRRSKNPKLASRLVEWAEASDRRAEEMRSGPLFGGDEP